MLQLWERYKKWEIVWVGLWRMEGSISKSVSIDIFLKIDECDCSTQQNAKNLYIFPTCPTCLAFLITNIYYKVYICYNCWASMYRSLSLGFLHWGSLLVLYFICLNKFITICLHFYCFYNFSKLSNNWNHRVCSI